MAPVIDITAADIDTSGVAVEIVLPVAWLERELGDANATAIGEGHVSARLSRSGRADIVAHGHVKAAVEVPCARCLKPASIDLSTELSLLLTPKAPAPKTASPAKAAAEARRSERSAARARNDKTEDYEFTSEEADKDEYDGERVILDPFVREALLLELPSFPLCEEGCQGLAGGDLPKAPDLERRNPFAVLKDWSPDGPETRTDDAASREAPKPGKRVLLGSSHLQKAPPGKKRSQKRAQAASKVSPAGPRKV